MKNETFLKRFQNTVISLIRHFCELFFIFEDSKVQYKAAYINLVSASDVASREYTQPWAKWMCQLAKKAK